MKNLLNAIRSAFCGKEYTARMIIAGQELSVTIEAPDAAKASEEAERIIDGCGFLINISENTTGRNQWETNERNSMISNTGKNRRGALC